MAHPRIKQEGQLDVRPADARNGDEYRERVRPIIPEFSHRGNDAGGEQRPLFDDGFPIAKHVVCPDARSDVGIDQEDESPDQVHRHTVSQPCGVCFMVSKVGWIRREWLLRVLSLGLSFLLGLGRRRTIGCFVFELPFGVHCEQISVTTVRGGSWKARFLLSAGGCGRRAAGALRRLDELRNGKERSFCRHRGEDVE